MGLKEVIIMFIFFTILSILSILIHAFERIFLNSMHEIIFKISEFTTYIGVCGMLISILLKLR